MAYLGIVLFAVGCAIMIGAALFLFPAPSKERNSKRPDLLLETFAEEDFAPPPPPTEEELFQRWYKEGYLRSPRWRAKRQQILERAAYRCELCGSSERLDVHHLTYDRVRNELPTDLVALCRSCHQKQHPDKINRS